MASKEKQIYELALNYRLDGASLHEALSLANKEYEASLSRRTKLTEAQATKIKAMIIAKEKETLQQVEMADRASQRRKGKEVVAEAKKANRLVEAEEKKSVERRKNTFLGAWGNFSKKLGTISSYGGAIAIISTVVNAFKSLVTAGIELEAGFIDLQVKSGYTQREMAKVSKTILDVAQSTKFSTLEITGAATALGKLGFEGEEVSKMLPNLANLAGATGESLQASAEILGKVLNAYEYTAEQSGIIADRMVDVFNNSALSLEKFNTAFSYVGSAAASTGTSFNELTAAMAVLSDRGITASKIGTGLRNVFTKLGKEGDSLRDIIQRVADGHLSFYEVAELVGRRAANQLFIMADSLDEFDSMIARSTEDYGEAARAAAVQMDSFKSQYEILINTLKNYVAPEFDEDKKWRNSISDSMGWLATFNAMMGEANEVAYFGRITQQYPQFAKDLNNIRKEIGETKNDYELLQKLRDKLKREGAVDEDGKKVSKKELADYVDSIEAFMDFAQMRLLFGNSRLFINELDTQINDKIINDAEEAVILWQDTVQAAVSGIAKTADKNKFLEIYFGKDRSLIGQMLSDLKEAGDITDKEFTELVKGLTLPPERFAKELEKYRVEGLESYKEYLTRIFNDTREEIKKSTGGILVTDESDLANLVANDKKYIKELIEKDRKNRDLICKDSKSVARALGIVCEKEKSKRDRGEIGDMDSFVKLEEDYKTKKLLLEEQYKDIADDDPVGKLRKNRELIILEEQFRDNLNRLYEDYLEKQASLRDSFCAKYPDQCKQFDDKIEKTKDAQIKDEAEGERNLIKLTSRDIEDRIKAYKVDVEEREKYKLAVAKIDNELQRTDRRDLKKRKELLIQKNKLTDDFYDAQIKKAEDHLVEIEKRLEDLQKVNAVSAVSSALGFAIDGIQIDTTETIKRIKELIDLIAKLKTEKEEKQDEGKQSDNKDVDLFPYIMGAAEDIYEVYKLIGDQKLELLREQTERELEIIQQRFDSEAEIRNSALESGIISQEQATEAEERAHKKKIDRENKINKKLFDAQKKRDKEDAIFQGLSNTAQAISHAFAKKLPLEAAILAAISAAAIATQTAINVGAISKRKFIPQKYAEGGLIEGKSHAQGGVPFTVNGRGGFEAEGGEFIVNKEATKRHLSELQRINSKTQKSRSKFATGGYVEPISDSDDFNQLLLEALSKPVRAFVTDQDLAKSTSEREALTKKISY